MMSNLVVLGFDGLHTADEVLNKLRSMQKEYLIDLEDACVVDNCPAALRRIPWKLGAAMLISAANPCNGSD
jgi:uncharacterized membrane protein